MNFMIQRLKAPFLTLILFISLVTSALAQGPTILLNYADFGVGHDKAAQVLAKEIQKQDPTATVIIMNGREFMKWPMSSVSKVMFDWLQPEFPKVYHALYKLMMFQSKLAAKFNWNQPSVAHMKIKHMQNFAEAVMPDAVVDAWPLTVEARIPLMKAGATPYDDAALFYQMTDWERELYFKLLADASITAVPNTAIFEYFKSLGSDPARMMDTGIPSEFKFAFPKDEAERTQRRNEALARVKTYEAEQGRPDFDVNKPTFTIEGGGNAVGNYALRAASIALAAGDRPIQILAACGIAENSANRRAIESFGTKKLTERVSLFLKLSPLLRKGVSIKEIWNFVTQGLPNTTIFAHGFTDKLMDFRFASLFTIAKPGALSLTELGGNGVPTIVDNSRAASVEVANVRELRGMGVIDATNDEAGVGSLINGKIAEGGEAILEQQRSFRDGIRPDLFVARILAEANRVHASRELKSPERVLTVEQMEARIEAVPGLKILPELYRPGETQAQGAMAARRKETVERAKVRSVERAKKRQEQPKPVLKKAA